MTKAATANRGFTLVEALVALAILSFGLLGIAAMQLKALQSAHIGYQRSLVSLIAIDGQERVWKHFAENDRQCPTATELEGIDSDWFEGWESLVGFINRSASGDLSTGMSFLNNCAYDVSVAWDDPRVLPPPVDCEDEIDVLSCEEEQEEQQGTSMEYGFMLPPLR